MWPSLSPEATSRRTCGCWRGYFVEHNNRTEEGDRLVASGVELQGFMEAGVRPMRLQGCCLSHPLINGVD